MIIEEFTEKLEMQLHNFQEDWYCKALIDNVNYNVDTEMSLPEWLEQFTFYLEEIR